MRRTLTTILLAGLLILAIATPAFASLGVGTDTGKITIDQPLVAGGSYPLTQFGIFNAGDTAYGYSMHIAPSNRKGMLAPEAWFVFSPAAFYLAPKASNVVHTTLHVSVDATPGVYSVQLQGSPKLPDSKTPGGHLNVGAGPVLTFTVVQPNPWQHVYFLFMDYLPWSGIAVIVLVVVLVLAVWLAIRAVLSRRAEPAADSSPCESEPAPAPGAESADQPSAPEA
jgi:hypothetical protein